jgi:hypothetical protein
MTKSSLMVFDRPTDPARHALKFRSRVPERLRPGHPARTTRHAMEIRLHRKDPHAVAGGHDDGATVGGPQQFDRSS